jgi:hypothetical protein
LRILDEEFDSKRSRRESELDAICTDMTRGIHWDNGGIKKWKKKAVMTSR